MIKIEKFLEIFGIIFIVGALFFGLYVLGTMVHEAQHVQQLKSLGQTPNEICWNGYIKTERPLTYIAGWVRFGNQTITLSEDRPYMIQSIWNILSLIITLWAFRLLYTRILKGGSS